MIFLRMELSRWPTGSSLSSSFSWIENNSKNFDFLNLFAFTASFYPNSSALLYSSWSLAFSSLWLVFELSDITEFLEEQTVLPFKELITDLMGFSLITAWVLKMLWPSGDDRVDLLWVGGGGTKSDELTFFDACFWTFGESKDDLERISAVFFWRESKGGNYRGWEFSDYRSFKFCDTVLFLLRSRSCWGKMNLDFWVGEKTEDCSEN